MSDHSTAHVHRADVATRRASDWLEVAEAHAPAGFSHGCDGVLIHRDGTVLHAGASALRLLGLGREALVVGSSLLELFDPSERELVAAIVGQATRRASHTKPRALLLSTPNRSGVLEITALHADDASPPVDVMYLCPRGSPVASSEGAGPEVERPDGERPEPASRPVTVLICDDEARLGALTAGLLSEFGFAPVAVGNGDEALTTLARDGLGVDVVLLDVNLSEGPSASEVLAGMKSRGSSARVILTSGLAEEDIDPALLEHPLVVGYVAKPYGVDQLVQSIRTAVAKGRS